MFWFLFWEGFVGVCGGFLLGVLGVFEGYVVFFHEGEERS